VPRRVIRQEQPQTGTPAVPAPDVSRVDDVIGDLDTNGNLILVLQRLQQEFGYLPELVIDELSRLSGVPASRRRSTKFSVSMGTHSFCGTC